MATATKTTARKTAAAKAAPVTETVELTAEELAAQAAAEKAERQGLTPLFVLAEDRDKEHAYFDFTGSDEVGGAVTIVLPKTVKTMKVSATFMAAQNSTANEAISVFSVLDGHFREEAFKLQFIEDDFETVMAPLATWAWTTLLVSRSPKSV